MSLNLISYRTFQPLRLYLGHTSSVRACAAAILTSHPKPWSHPVYGKGDLGLSSVAVGQGELAVSKHHITIIKSASINFLVGRAGVLGVGGEGCYDSLP